MIPLQTSKVWLTPLSDADEDLFVELYTSARLMSKIAEPLTVSRAQAAFIKTLQLTLNPRPTIMSWVVKDKINGQSLGIAGFAAIEYPHQADLGIILLREAQGKGIVVDICNVMCRYLIRQVAISQVRAEFHHKNYATREILRKLGFSSPKSLEYKDGFVECYLSESPLDTK